jgi:hypothetical protein
VSTESAQALEIVVVKKRRLHHLKLQAARTGTTTDPSVTMEIEDLEQEIQRLDVQAGHAITAVGLPSALVSGTADVRVDSPSPLLQPIAMQLNLAKPLPRVCCLALN